MDRCRVRVLMAPERVLTDEEIDKLAKSRVGFRVHALVYVAVNLLLAAIWLVTMAIDQGTSGYTFANYWPIWPHLGWGVGLAIHGFVAYGGGVDWEAREAEKIRRRSGRT